MLPRDWDTASVEELLSAKKGASRKKIQSSAYLATGKYPVIDQGKAFISGYTDEPSVVVNASPSEPVIVFGDHTRELKYVDFPFAPGADGTKILVPDRRRIHPLFAYYALMTIRLPPGGYARHYSLLREQSISFPRQIDEQLALASPLALWDRAIDRTERLIAAKEQRRKWLMQQLLTGKRRLPGFEEEWKTSTLGELLYEVKRPVEWDDAQLYRLISLRRASGGLFLREERYGHQIKTKKMNVAREGDFLISRMQVVHGASGLTPTEFDGFHISDSYTALRTRDEEVLDIRYFDWLAKTPQLYHLALVSSYGVHIEKMTFDLEEYFDQQVKIPASVKEQRAIIDVLTTADRELDLLRQTLAAYREQKKGLMQQLLTGRRRVPVRSEAA